MKRVASELNTLRTLSSFSTAHLKWAACGYHWEWIGSRAEASPSSPNVTMVCRGLRLTAWGFIEYDAYVIQVADTFVIGVLLAAVGMV